MRVKSCGSIFVEDLSYGFGYRWIIIWTDRIDLH